MVSEMPEMPKPEKDDDDFDLSLPSLDGETEEEEEGEGVSSISEESGIENIDEEEPVDFDTSTGLDQASDDEDIFNSSDADEKESWSSIGEADDAIVSADDDLVNGEENGWLDDSEPMEREEWGADDLISESEQESEEDGGEEGVEDDVRIDGPDDEASLPPLNLDDDDESNDSDEDERFGRQILEEEADPRLIEGEDE
jgi:hypothetical protein